MGRINVLSMDVANKIAAGEVVERPASIIKELTENALDAGSTQITAEIQNGGITYIRVTDNGCGMEKSDVKTAFLRHATSKIKSSDDLETISTLGFRGEALSSIAAVSKVDVMTREKGSDEGYMLELHGGEPVSEGAAGCPDGTTIIVRDVFYNTPARMKFLKTDRAEGSYIGDIMERIALCRPDVSVRFIQDGKLKLQTPGDGKLLSSIYSVYGKEYVENIRTVDRTEAGIRVHGIVGMPSLSRGNRRYQSFFVNGRYVKSHTMTVAAEEAFKNKLTVGRFPFFVLNIEVPLGQVDVNVHPQKTEVKFSDEKKLYQAVYWAVFNAVMMPEKKLEEIKTPIYVKPESAQNRTVLNEPQKPILFRKLAGGSEFTDGKNITEDKAEEHKDTLYKKSSEEQLKKDPVQPFRSVPSAGGFNMASEHQARDIIKELHETLTDSIPAATENKKPVIYEEQTLIDSNEELQKDYKPAGQIFDTYIIADFGDEVVFIDQHAAHERQIYEKLIQNEIQSQMLLIPMTVSLSSSEHAVVIENKDFFEKLGFEIDDFGNNTIAVRQTPVAFDTAELNSVITEIIENISIGRKFIQTDSMDKAMYTIACKAAIKANKALSEKEMKELADWVFAQNGIDTCPHGRPLTCKFTKHEIEKMFKRT